MLLSAVDSCWLLALAALQHRDQQQEGEAQAGQKRRLAGQR